MPENAARKKLVRELAHAKGIAYTAALRLLSKGPRPLRVLKPGEASAAFGRAVGVVVEPKLPGPVVIGSWGIGARLREIRLSYVGASLVPQAFVVTNLPLDGEEPEAGVLDTVLHNFIAAQDRTSQSRDEVITGALRAVREASRESAQVSLDGTMTPVTRVRVGAVEGVEIPFRGGCIVYCGLVEHASTLRLGLDRAA